MSTFAFKWLKQPENDERETSVSSVSAIDERTAGKNTPPSAQSMPSPDGGGGGSDNPADTPEKRTDTTDRSAPHPTPSRCLGPTACAVLGICGREDCLAADEFGPFASAMVTARRSTNPHVVPDFYAPGQEVDHAA